MNYSVSVGFCVWNEDENILGVIKDAFENLDKDFGRDNYEILVVDNCSTDNTADLVKQAFKNKSNCKLIQHTENLLYSGSNNSIMNNAKGRYIFTLDGDGQHTTADIKKSIDFMERGNLDVLFGWKKFRKDGVARKIISTGFRVVSFFAIKNTLHDINCGFRGFRAKTTQDLKLNIKVNSAGPEYFCIARSKGLKYGELPIQHFPRPEGEGIFTGILPLTKGIINFLEYLNLLNKKYSTKLSMRKAEK